MSSSRGVGKSKMVLQGWWPGHTPAAPPRAHRDTSTAAVADAPTSSVEEDGRVRGRTAARDACRAVESAASSPQPLSTARSLSPGQTGALGYRRHIDRVYQFEGELGRGANGIVTQVVQIATGRRFACKSIPKRPKDMPEEKVEGHIKAVKREIRVLEELRTCLNVAKLEDVYEDDERVHMVMELCTGGEIAHSVGQRHYSERTVASYMRAVLRTIAQCHAHNILHRDIKPGNFLLADTTEEARVKAVDFGLAVMYSEKDDLTTLDMQGTPWFLAPETLSSKWSPAADLWAAGVMAYQLLTGRLPFNDKRNPHTPALSAVLRSILTDKLDFNRSYWQDISPEGKDFVAKLLDREPARRPTAAEALSHPWLAGDVSDRRRGAPLSLAVVARLQRYGRNSALRRSLLELIAAELLVTPAVSTPDEPLAAHPVGGSAAEAAAGPVPAFDQKGRPLMDSPQAVALERALSYLGLRERSTASRATVAAGLERMGYRVAPDEFERLFPAAADGGDAGGSVSRAAVVAALLDWRWLQQRQKARWLAVARRAFDALDADADGALAADDIVAALDSKLPADRIDAAYGEAQAAISAGRGEGSGRGSDGSAHGGLTGRPAAGARGMSFKTFMDLIRVPSADSLDFYDDRFEGTVSSLRSPGSSVRGKAFMGSSHNGKAGLLFNGSSHGGAAAAGSAGSVGALAAACALDARRESLGAGGLGDRSTHHGRELSTVFERAERE